ncbi:hypothetical protein [Anaeroselena agilis]|uniref:Uncharacterized protein n=1 Tax=Anaeroselena agilis TaxID=3063788 RepID=A0ABU3P3M9_9FIRM|nr:hypothetical protein [Selenomonadales bacterium 4137-cl]
MNRLDSVILKLLLYGLPLIVGLAVLAAAQGWRYIDAAGRVTEAPFHYSNPVIGLIFGLWLLLAVYLLIRLVASGEFREKVLSRLTFIRERDEREALLTGKAAKTTMLTTLAVLLVLFFLSCLRLSVSTLPPEQAVNGKNKTLTIGAAFSLTADSRPEQPEPGKTVVAYTGLPVSGSAVIAGLIIWQIAAYNYSMRRLMK